MSSTAFITIADYPIESFQNHFYPWLFKKSDRQIVNGTRAGRNRFIWGAPDPEDKDEPEQWYVYVSRAATIKRRLELAGCTRATLDVEFKTGIDQWLEAIQRYEDEHSQAQVQTLKTASLTAWLDALRQVMNRGLRYSRWERTDYKDDILNIMLNYDPRFELDGVWYSTDLNFPCATLDGLGRAFLEIVPDDARCVLDVTDLVDGGWTDAFDDLIEYSRPFTTLYETFDGAIGEIRNLMILSPDNQSLIRLLYANVISSMEAYLGDTLKKNVLTREPLLRRFVESHKHFAQSKITMADLFKEHSRIRTTVSELLAETIFHDISKTRSLYGSVFAAAFPEHTLEALHRAVVMRHHIVHRNGRDHAGEPVTLTLSDLEGLIEVVTVTIRSLDAQIKDGLIEDDDL
jgi:hypothetical protein